MTRLLINGLPASLTLVLLLTGSGASANSLYRCVTATEGTIYTDNPAQLEQCVPMTASGAVTSLATVSSGVPPTGVSPAPLPITEALPEPPAAMSPGESSPAMIGAAPPTVAPSPLPCAVGVNPLNPLSAPPCPAAEATPPATNSVPPDPGTAPAFPLQP